MSTHAAVLVDETKLTALLVDAAREDEAFARAAAIVARKLTNRGGPVCQIGREPLTPDGGRR